MKCAILLSLLSLVAATTEQTVFLDNEQPEQTQVEPEARKLWEGDMDMSGGYYYPGGYGGYGGYGYGKWIICAVSDAFPMHCPSANGSNSLCCCSLKATDTHLVATVTDTDMAAMEEERCTRVVAAVFLVDAEARCMA